MDAKTNSPIVPKYIYEYRQKICNECPFHKKFLNRCSICGCFMSIKTKLLNSSCPNGYWGNPKNSWGGF
jgi:hypothetical protein